MIERNGGKIQSLSPVTFPLIKVAEESKVSPTRLFHLDTNHRLFTIATS